MTSEEKESHVYRAKLAEQAERYDGEFQSENKLLVFAANNMPENFRTFKEVENLLEPVVIRTEQSSF